MSDWYKLPFCMREYIPKPSPHPTNSECIIISTHYEEDETTAGIYTYNLQTNESQMIYEYNDTTFKPYGHGQFIDVSNNTLILYGGYHETFYFHKKQIFILNLLNMKWYKS
eukprot:328489_1